MSDCWAKDALHLERLIFITLIQLLLVLSVELVALYLTRRGWASRFRVILPNHRRVYAASAVLSAIQYTFSRIIAVFVHRDFMQSRSRGFYSRESSLVLVAGSFSLITSVCYQAFVLVYLAAPGVGSDTVSLAARVTALVFVVAIASGLIQIYVPEASWYPFLVIRYLLSLVVVWLIIRTLITPGSRKSLLIACLIIGVETVTLSINYSLHVMGGDLSIIQNCPMMYLVIFHRLVSPYDRLIGQFRVGRVGGLGVDIF